MHVGDYSNKHESESVTCGIILSYHRVARPELDPWGLRVSPENFAQQISVLRQFGSPISLPDFASSYQNGTAPERAIVVTFDDGYLDNLTHALPLLKKYGVPATVFISTAYTDQDYFWWEALEHVFLRSNRLPQSLILQLNDGPMEWELGDASYYETVQYERDCISCKWRGERGSRIRIYHEVYDVLWSLGHAQRLQLVNDIILWAGMDRRSFSDSRPMNAEEIKTMGHQDIISIGAHSVNHLPLDEKPIHIQESEILGSRRVLEHVLNRPVNTFAFPHGKFCDESVNILKTNEFLCACTTRESGVERSTDPLLLPRYSVSDWTIEQFREKLAGWM